MKLPSSLTLPSGRRLDLHVTGEAKEPRSAEKGAPLFSEVLDLLEGGIVRIEADAAALDAHDLALGDFHVLRALLVKAGFVAEEEVTITCRNCGADLAVNPCAALETAPWIDGELGDPELDATLPFGDPITIHVIALGKVRNATTVTFAARTVRESLPLFAAVARDPFEVTADVVTSMGIEALGPETSPKRIAEALAECDDLPFDAVTRAYLDGIYPLRLGAIAFCKKCKARNDVDAPYEREFPSAPPEDGDADGVDVAHSRLPDAGDFADLAHEIAEPLVAEIPGEKVDLVVDDRTAAVDDGGEPLLGAYEPPIRGEDPRMPTRPPTVTIYYRTFAKIEKEEGPYDWEDELRETIEHEIEHHVYWLRGDDPMDAAERNEIDREALRVIGKREAARRTAKSFGQSVKEFFVRAWPLVLIAFLALVATLASQRC